MASSSHRLLQVEDGRSLDCSLILRICAGSELSERFLICVIAVVDVGGGVWINFVRNAVLSQWRAHSIVQTEGKLLRF